MDNCIFCKIVNKEIPGKIIYEDDICLAFLDLSQTTDGHTLLIPKKHFKNVLETENATLSHMIIVAKNLANKIVKKTGAQGCHILTNANEAAGQTVPHFHIHIIPRFNESDSISINFTDRSKETDLDEIAHKILS
ncbi:HIT family protein [Eggerthia catenaformis]|uniref:HIT family protein n=1 Tax=Eggerthia catenaformis TaxID=31973 RepID=UPI0028EB357B|nr:HIT family protein [Eggerthia catenaformis]